MVIELSELKDVPVQTVTGQALGKLDMAIFNGKEATLMGFQVVRSGMMKKFSGLYFADVVDLSPAGLIIENDQQLKPNLRDLDTAFHNFGPVIGISAQTESGVKIGKVADVYLDLTTGGITRFFIRNFLQERIIPRQYLVAITPQRVVFKDIVNQPAFHEVATQATQA